ncbi:hypothetical protein M422DRAFT_37517, partial [Sphaerobolus stellatus SS14]
TPYSNVPAVRANHHGVPSHGLPSNIEYGRFLGGYQPAHPQDVFFRNADWGSITWVPTRIDHQILSAISNITGGEERRTREENRRAGIIHSGGSSHGLVSQLVDNRRVLGGFQLPCEQYASFNEDWNNVDGNESGS